LEDEEFREVADQMMYEEKRRKKLEVSIG